MMKKKAFQKKPELLYRTLYLYYDMKLYIYYIIYMTLFILYTYTRALKPYIGILVVCSDYNFYTFFV